MKKPPEDLTPDAKETLRVENRFVEIGRLNSIKEKRLRDLYFIWCNPINAEGKKQSLRVDEIKELRESAIIKNATEENPSGPVAADVDICDSQEELAKRMMIHFQNPDKTSKLRIEITKKTISDWHLGKRLSGNIPPFPKIEGARKRYSLRAVIEWFNAYLWHDYRADANQTNGAAASLFVPIGELRDKVERAELEKREFDIMVEKGEYVKLINAEQISAGEMSKVHLRWKNEIENIPLEKIESKMQQVEIAPDKAAAMMDFMKSLFQGITNAIEDAAEKAQRELAQTLELDAETNKK